jgi:mono/diheme cytochrome c family protein
MLPTRVRSIPLGIQTGARLLGIAALLVWAAPAAAQQASDVTFSKDIAPVFQRSCQQCHMPGAIGPMSLTTYQEVRPWARSIKNKVMAGEMPPYRYDRHIGIQDLEGDLRLSEAEIDMIARWVDAGAPQGNPADLPAPVTFANPNDWAYAAQFGPPDLIIKTDPFTLAANGQDVWWRPTVPTGLTTDRCIRAISVKPSLEGRAAAHHANSTLVVYNEQTGEYDEAERLSEYALGKTGEIIPADACRVLPANSLVRWDVHYYPTGEELVNDVIDMGVWLYPEEHQSKYKQDLKMYSLLMKGGELELPPGGTAMTQGFHSFDHPIRIDSFQPHGHFRLVGKTLEIFYPETGKLEMISSVSNWTNSWHTSHIYAPDAAPLLPAGAVLVITGYYDNSANNPSNPDPSVWVGLGSRTADEMSHAWIAITHLDEEGYQALKAEREAKATSQTQQQQQQ